MSPIETFLFGFILLILFAWYLFSDSERAKRIVGTVLTVLLVGFCLQAVYPPIDVKDANEKVIKTGKINLGLDLRGGTSFLIQLIPTTGETEDKKDITKDMVEQAMEAIRKRVDQFGVSEQIITPQGKDRILVQIPGLDAAKFADAREQLQKVAKLEFRLVHPNNESLLEAIRSGNTPPDPNYIRAKEKITRGDKTIEGEILVRKKPDLTGDKVNRAAAVFGQKGWEVVIGFNNVGAKQFGELTQQYVGKRFAIMLDGEVISAPVINEPIMGGSAQISGSFQEKEARNLAS